MFISSIWVTCNTVCFTVVNHVARASHAIWGIFIRQYIKFRLGLYFAGGVLSLGTLQYYCLHSIIIVYTPLLDVILEGKPPLPSNILYKGRGEQ